MLYDIDVFEDLWSANKHLKAGEEQEWLRKHKPAFQKLADGGIMTSLVL
jgi:hypothetical protein